MSKGLDRTYTPQQYIYTLPSPPPAKPRACYNPSIVTRLIPMTFVLLFLIVLFPSLAFSQEQAPAPPILAANSYALYDYTSGQFLVSQNANAHIPPAHLTKLMTAYVIFGAIKQGKISLTQRLIPSAYATRMQTDESRMFLNAGKK